MLAYFNGSFMQKEDIRISPDDRGFLFADGIYDVVRCYEGVPFQMEGHIDRLNRSSRHMRFTCTDFEYLDSVARTLIRKNDLNNGNALVYMQVTRGSAPRNHFFPPADTPLTVYCTAYPYSPNMKDYDEGIDVLLISDQRWARCDIKTINLAANVLARQRGMERNAHEALFVRDGSILEGTHSNVAAVRDGTLITPPKSNYILPGITRETVLTICKNESIPYEETPLYESDIDSFDEVMIIGTGIEIHPVVAIDGKPIKRGEPGPVTRKIQEAYSRMTSENAKCKM